MSAHKAAIRNELGRILASERFRLSDRRKKFLSYLVEHSLRDDAERLKEYTIGIEVFGRDESFDPRLDNVVRNEARKLREALDYYYDREGQSSSLRIELPKGGYLPFFRLTQGNGNIAAVQEPIDGNLQTSEEAPVSGTKNVKLAPRKRFARLTYSLGISLMLGVLAIISWTYSYMGVIPLLEGTQPSVVVLPFLDLSQDKSWNNFSEGLTEELIDRLARIPGLSVVALSSSLRYRGEKIDLRQLGQDLHVRTALEGSFRTEANRIRVTAHLSDTNTGFSLWSQSFDSSTNSIVNIQKEIAEAIAKSLDLSISAMGREIRTEQEVNPDAYRNYLRGRYYLLLRVSENEAWAAIDSFNKAIALDPSYAPAYTGLAEAYNVLPRVSNFSPQESYSKVKAAANKALELDSSLAGAHLQLALVAMYTYDWSLAKVKFEKALELSPGNAIMHHWYSSYLERTGRLSEALTQKQLAVALDPMSSWMHRSLARILYDLGRYDDALARLANAEALDPDSGDIFRKRALVYIEKSDCSSALDQAPKADNEGIRGYVYGICGQPTEARRILAQLLQAGNNGSVRAVRIAQIYIGLGEKDMAFEWLEKAIRRREEDIFLKADPIYNLLRSDARFSGLLHQMNLN